MTRVNPKMAIASIFSVAVYLGLAILGWGGISPFFASNARCALALVTVLLTIAGAFSSGNLSSGEREDRGNRWVIAAFGIIGFVSAYVPAYTERIGFWTFGGDGVRWLGVVLFGAGGVLRLWPVFVLGRRFSGLVAIQPGHTLVTTGIYKTIRNPSYLGLLISVFGWALAFRSGTGLVLAALNIPPLVARMRSEEKLLLENFGEDYARYRDRTARLIPGLY
ncbi:MAG TPA: isoprenylcysteine carboxylmethyltransferase family protein [Rhizomicrobium sp.]|nr:isoprenylcysteine carboxylmethyltransferase family protein [Rhizomicrobium sp.]